MNTPYTEDWEHGHRAEHRPQGTQVPARTPENPDDLNLWLAEGANGYRAVVAADTAAQVRNFVSREPITCVLIGTTDSRYYATQVGLIVESADWDG